ncbi:hypothetical protein NL108_006382 [Boleophthalmus pectinirostris]|nr:hypothetical protein NL108_006382 [Boleophthalmus pectinirostris]
MLLLALVFELLVPCSAQEQMLRIEAKCGSDAALPCNADFRTNRYKSVTWYKTKGIIRISLTDNESFKYDFPRAVSVEKQNYSLLLANVRPEDSGVYKCEAGGILGEKTLYLQVMLTVPECEPDVTTASMTTVQREETEGALLNVTHAPHLPLTWSLVGYTAMGLTKIIMSMIIIRILHICSRQKRR